MRQKCLPRAVVPRQLFFREKRMDFLVAHAVEKELPEWLAATQEAHARGQAHPPLTLLRGARRLIFSAAEYSEDEQWMIVLREEWIIADTRCPDDRLGRNVFAIYLDAVAVFCLDLAASFDVDP